MILFNCIPFGTSLKGKSLLPEGANSFFYEQFPIVWKITFITLSDLPWMLLFLLCKWVTCVMDATPMKSVVLCWLSKLTFPKNSLRNIIKVSSTLDSDQYRHSVQAICKGYQQLTKGATSKERVNK